MSDQPTLQQLAGSVIIGGFDGTELPATLRVRLVRGLLGGVTLFARNITSLEQVAALCGQISSCGPRDAPPLISIDQEGGRVARLKAPLPLLPPMRALGRIDDVRLTQRVGRMLGETLSSLGINMDFAPVTDVDSNPDNPVIGDRSFGSDPALVSRHVVALTEGLQGAGVAACAKHFPGHGDTEQDSHLALPRLNHDRARLEAIELPPFRAAIKAGVASVMTAHVVFEPLTGALPATFASSVVQDLLRGSLGFAGVCFSDDLHMKAVSATTTVEDASIQAITAGCDALLICTDPDAQERARLAMVQHATNNDAFAARLREAHQRVMQLRRAFPARPPSPNVLSAVLDPLHVQLREEIDARLAKLE